VNARYPESQTDEQVEDGLSKLILAIVKVLLEVMERQAARRAGEGSLSADEVERLGRALIRVRSQFSNLCLKFGLNPDDLGLPVRTFEDIPEGDNILHPGTTEPLINNEMASSNRMGLTAHTLANILDRLIEKQTTIAGEVTMSLAGIELVVLRLLASLQPVRSKAPAKSRAKS
jgi:hypothetical protein